MELRTGEWSHLVFIFSNDTAALEESAKGEEGVLYTLSLMVNGRHDSTIKYKVPVTPNEGAFWLGQFGYPSLCGNTSTTLSTCVLVRHRGVKQVEAATLPLGSPLGTSLTQLW